MRAFLSIISIVIIFNVRVLSQDVIVKQDGDVIECEIQKITFSKIYFNENANLNVSTIKNKEVKTYKRAFDRYYFDINVGRSWRPISFSGVPKGLEDYSDNSKSGINLGLNLLYQYKEAEGIGVMYSLFFSNNEKDSYRYMTSFGERTTHVQNDYKIHYLGLVYRLRSPFYKQRFIMDFSAGYLGYKEKAFFIEPSTVTGGAFGAYLNMQYEVPILNNMSMAIIGSLYGGSLKKITYEYESETEVVKAEEPEEMLSLARVDLTIALRFNR